MVRGRSPSIFLTAGLISLLICFQGCATLSARKDPWLGRDKAYHFAVTMAIGSGMTLVAQNNGASDAGAPMIGLSAALAVGASKELYDARIKKTFWSWRDMFWDFAGGAAGSLAAGQGD